MRSGTSENTVLVLRQFSQRRSEVSGGGDPQDMQNAAPSMLIPH